MTSELLRLARPGSSVFIISDFNDLDQEGLNNISNLRRHCDVIPVFVYDEMEQQLPRLGNCTFTDGSDQQSCNTADRQLRQRFSEHFQQRLTWLSQSLLDHGIPLIQVATHQNAPQLLQELFSTRANPRHRDNSTRESEQIAGLG